MGSGTSKSTNKERKQAVFVERETPSVVRPHETETLRKAEPSTGLLERAQQGMKVQSILASRQTSCSRAVTKVGNRDWKLSSLARGTITPLSGVTWRINPKLESIRKTIRIPELQKLQDIQCKSRTEVENEYNYTFDVERRVT